MRFSLFLVAAVALGCSRDPVPQQTAATPQAPAPTTDAKWVSLLTGLDSKKQAVAGNWSLDANGLRVAAMVGARLFLGPAPRGEYDLRIEFTRRTGADSIVILSAREMGRRIVQLLSR